jgi:antitoxin (DNA-binding transcriptional repressor) of toxin-antitoxin stability system
VKVAGMRELRAKSAALFGSGEPLLVTRHGRVFGVYVPLDQPDRLPDDLRRELAGVVGRHLAKALARKGVSERDITENFDAYRRRRR